MFIGAETYIFNRNDTATSIQNVINSHFPDVVVTGTGTDIDPFIV